MKLPSLTTSSVESTKGESISLISLVKVEPRKIIVVRVYNFIYSLFRAQFSDHFHHRARNYSKVLSGGRQFTSAYKSIISEIPKTYLRILQTKFRDPQTPTADSCLLMIMVSVSVLLSSAIPLPKSWGCHSLFLTKQLPLKKGKRNCEMLVLK